jgi:hypothetical protein
MEIEFKCPHCGVVTFFDASNLGEIWSCRGCRVEAVISQREDDEQDEWEGDKLGEEMHVFESDTDDDEDETNAGNFRRTQTAEQEDDSRGGRGRTVISSAVLAMVLITSGRAVLNMMRPRSNSSRTPTFNQQEFRDYLDRLEKTKVERSGSNEGLFGAPQMSEDQKAILEKMIESSEVYRFSPDQIPQLSPR